MLNEFLANAGPFVLSDGGIETMLIFDDGLDLPHFAAFHLLKDEPGRAALVRYYGRFIAVAKGAGAGFILESPTWRASPDWGDLLGYSKAELAGANRAAIALMGALREKHQQPDFPMLVSGCVGPRGDGYVASALMRAETAQAYHGEQITALAGAGADLITAMTMTNTAEAIGIARAATRHAKACVISFTVETDGRLPTGQSIADAIKEVDAATEAAPAFYMLNCAHPTHFEAALREGKGAAWTHRLRGVRANASCKSHAELNQSPEIDRGDPAALGAQYRALRQSLPHLKVLGGCCGTDHAHIAAIAKACQDEGEQ